MYKLHLILKYLRKRRIAWVSLIAVILCTTMVLVVISVMGGWLTMFRDSFHGLSGDVSVVSRSLTGFAHYQEMVDKIEKLPEVEAAVPVIRSYALIKINHGSPATVQVLGYPADIGRVNSFPQSLHRQYDEPLAEGKPPATQPSFALLPDVPYSDLVPPNKVAPPDKWPGMIVGCGVVGIEKDMNGVLQYPPGLLEAHVHLEVMGLTGEEVTLENAKPTPRNYWIVDDSRTKLWQFDTNTVYVPFETLQKDLGMNARVSIGDKDEKTNIQARTTDIHIKAKPGVSLDVLKTKVRAIVTDIYPEATDGLDPPIVVETWMEANQEFLGAVENEKSLVTFLFGIISVVAIFLIFCIFYMIVAEKTRDIGIIKSVGATSQGVAGIFLGYGLVIGLLGARAWVARRVPHRPLH